MWWSSITSTAIINTLIQQLAEQPVVFILSLGVLLTDIGIIAAAGIYGLKRLGIVDLTPRLAGLKSFLEDRYIELSFLFATVATTGSLYLSNVLKWEPCRLCWFQRIFMYPLVILIAVGYLFDKEDLADYVLPLTMVGIPISFYHYMVQRYEQFHSAGCSVLSVSCSTKYTFYFEYITIPMMALTAFTAILLLMWRFSRED